MAKLEQGSRYELLRIGDIILNINSRLRFDVVYIHRERGKRRGRITDIAIMYGVQQVHLYGEDAQEFLEWLRQIHPP